jgi:hypothetical protein
MIGAPTAEGVAMGFRDSMSAMTADLSGGMAGLFGGMGASAAGAGPLNVTINIYGAADATGVGRASRDGLLDALRSAGWRG